MTLIDEAPKVGLRAAATEPPSIEREEHEEYEARPPAETSAPETRARRAPAWAAVRGWVGSHLLSSGLAVALVAAVVVVALSQLSLSRKNSLDSARTTALVAAKGYSVDLASYDYKHLDQDFGKVLAESTPSFQKSFSQSSDALKSVLTRYDASAQAIVVAAGLVSATTNHAVVLVFLNQTVTNTTRKGKPATDESRVEIALVRSGGHWLISEVSLL